MNAGVLHFTPKAELDAKFNLTAFIELCRQSDVLGARAQFDQHIWDLGRVKGQNKVLRAVFSTLTAAQMRLNEPTLPQPFLDFAKAMLVYLQDKRPVVSHMQRVMALRYIEAALQQMDKGSRPTAVNHEVLDVAVELASESVSIATAYGIAGQMQLIAETMAKCGLISMRQPWISSAARPKPLGSRISKEALRARQDKLPSAAALRALAGIFQQAVEPRDVLVSSYTAVMACAPERINEVLRLQRNCVVKGDGRFVGKVGLRWPGTKGANDTVKWLPTEMAPVAERAIENLLKLSAPAQEVATWYTNHPDRLFLHKAAEHLRGQEFLTRQDLALILYGDTSSMLARSAFEWAAITKKLEKISLGGSRLGFRFRDVEAAVLAMLPGTFPYVPGAPELLCKDAIAITRMNELDSLKSSVLCMFVTVDYGAVTYNLTRPEGRLPSIFDKFRYTEDDGSPIEITSHALRHYLNMLAQMGGMTSAEIALFSGRKDVSQNRAYDHMSSDEVQEPISRALKAGMNGALVVKESRQLIRRSQFALANPTAAHTTEYGSCMHDFASEPCQMYADCLNCEEHECVKGEEHKERNLRSLKSETELLLKEARGALTEAEYGADVWVAHQTTTLERVNSLLQILENPSVPLGARIRLNVINSPLITDADTKPMRFFGANNQGLLK